MTKTLMRRKQSYLPALATTVVVAVGAGFAVLGSSAEVAHVIPVPVVD